MIGIEGGRKDGGKLTDINLLTDVGWTTINFESRCLRLPASSYPPRSFPARIHPPTRELAEIPREMPPSARPRLAFLIDCILLYFVAV